MAEHEGFRYLNLSKVLPALWTHPPMLLCVREILKCFADTLAEVTQIGFWYKNKHSGTTF